MKKSKMIARVFLIVFAVGLAAAGIWRWQSVSAVRAAGRMWKEAQKYPTPEEGSFSVKAEFAGLSSCTAEDLAWDQLSLMLSHEGDAGYSGFYGDSFFIDYWVLGGWQTVYRRDNLYSGMFLRWPEPLDLRLPSGLFAGAGLYRVRLVKERVKTREPYEAAGCVFWVGTPTRSMAGVRDNDYDDWRPAETEEDHPKESITLVSRGIDLEGERGPELKIGLTCQYPFCAYGEGRRVDRLIDGQWYTVTFQGAVRLYAMQIEVEPGVETILHYPVPDKVMDHPGVYRLYWAGLGYCEFQVEAE